MVFDSISNLACLNGRVGESIRVHHQLVGKHHIGRFHDRTDRHLFALFALFALQKRKVAPSSEPAGGAV